MGDQLDVPLEDSELLEEVEMVSSLMLAASEHEEPMDQAAIDRLLGVPTADATPRAEDQRTAAE